MPVTREGCASPRTPTSSQHEDEPLRIGERQRPLRRTAVATPNTSRGGTDRDRECCDDREGHDRPAPRLSQRPPDVIVQASRHKNVRRNNWRRRLLTCVGFSRLTPAAVRCPTSASLCPAAKLPGARQREPDGSAAGERLDECVDSLPHFWRRSLRRRHDHGRRDDRAHHPTIFWRSCLPLLVDAETTGRT